MIHSADQDSEPSATDNLSIAEIEAAYLRALETADAAEAFFPDVNAADDETDISSDVEVTAPFQEDTSATEVSHQNESGPATTIPQVIEALLFVADHPTPAKKISEVIGGTTSHEDVDLQVQSLNEQYEMQLRPYEIRLVEGGYQMSLKSEFEGVRRRVYGQGPKEVKLNQDGLEILAFIAYRQPATREEIEETGKQKAGGILRQLLRRQLITLQRGSDGEECYLTTGRFLELFGLASVEDLPQAEDFAFK